MARALTIFFENRGRLYGAIAKNIDDIPGFGKPDLLLKARRFSEKRFGKLPGQEKSFVRAGMGLAQEKDFSGTST